MAVFHSEFEIYFEDISPSGIVHLEKLAEWMSMSREQFFRQTCPGHLWLADGKITVFTVSMSITVLGRSRWADKIIGSITTSNIKRISYVVDFSFRNERTNELIAEGKQKVAFVRKDDGKISPVPEDIHKVVINYTL